MTGDTVEKISKEYRKKRVKRIKRFIIFLCVIIILLPTILSVILFGKLSSLESRFEKIEKNYGITDAAGTGSSTSVAYAKDNAKKGEGDGDAAPTETIASDKNDAGKVYLTFDDGPGTQTKKILDILKKEKVKATFFVIGKSDEYSKKLYKRIVDEGHTLGMHSYSHNYDIIYKSVEAFEKDFDKQYQMLYKVTGIYPEFYRFPGGSGVQQTTVSIDALISVLDEKKISYLDWNVLSPDIRDSRVTIKNMKKELMNEVARYDTSIVMFYDTEKQPKTVKALRSFIRSLKQKKYEILPIDQNTAPIRHNQ